MASSSVTLNRRYIFFYFNLPPYWSRSVLWFFYFKGSMNNWCSASISSSNYGFFRVCSSMGSDILLRCNSNYKFCESSSLYRDFSDRVNLRRLLCRKSNSNTLFHDSLPFTFCHVIYNNFTFVFSSYKGKFKSSWAKKKHI